MKIRTIIIILIFAFTLGTLSAIVYKQTGTIEEARKKNRELDTLLEEKTAAITQLTVEIMRREETKIGQPCLRVLKAEVLKASIEFDSGYVVKAKVRNTGEAGFITVLARLNSNEGTWIKTRRQYFLKGEERDEIFIFLGPSFWVKDVSALVGEEEPFMQK